MLLNKKVLALVNAASTDVTRYVLQGVLIEPDGSGVACDGHICLKFTPDDGQKPEDFPVIDGIDPLDGVPAGNLDEDIKPLPLQPFILPSDACKQIARTLPKKRGIHEVLQSIALDVAQTNKNGSAAMATTDLETPQVFRPKKIDGQYPDYTKVLPEHNPEHLKIGFGVDVLQKVLNTLKAMDVKTFSMEFTDNRSPVRIEASPAFQDGSIVGAVMPRRL